MQLYTLCKFPILFLLIIPCMYGAELEFTLSHDPITRAYIDAFYNNQCVEEPIYLLETGEGMFLEAGNDVDQLYFGTGYVQPRLRIAENQIGIGITYGTYFLMYEAYLEYLLAHPETVVLETSAVDAEKMNNDIQTLRLEKLDPLMAEYLVAICGEATDIFVAHAMKEYCSHPASIVKNNNEAGVQYIISAFFGEILFKRVKQKLFIPEAFDDRTYLCRIFNDRAHWTLVGTEKTALFNEHKDNPLNGGFLNKEQTIALFQTQQWGGLLAGLLREKAGRVYVDISGFMVGADKCAIMLCRADSGELCVVLSSYIVHLITKLKAKPFFVSVTPAVVETLHVENIS